MYQLRTTQLILPLEEALGMLQSELLQSTLWWHGPEWLQLAPDCWPLRIFTKPSMTSSVEELDNIFNRYSSHHHLVRVVTWMYSFISNCRAKSKKEKQLSATLSQDVKFCQRLAQDYWKRWNQEYFQMDQVFQEHAGGGHCTVQGPPRDWTKTMASS